MKFLTTNNLNIDKSIVEKTISVCGFGQKWKRMSLSLLILVNFVTPLKNVGGGQIVFKEK